MMTGVPAGVTGLALVCDFDGAVIEVPWDDLGLVSAATDLSHVACLLDPGSVQKGLALFLFVKENGAAFGWELNLATPDGPRHLHFSGTVLRDRVVLLAAEHPQEIGQVYDGLSHVINEQINAMRSLHKRAAGGRGRAHGEGAPKEQFDREMVQDLLRLNNRLVNAERELARKNSELKRLSSVLSKDLHLAHRVVQCSGEAVVVADRERRVVDVNQAYTAMTGFAPHEVLRTPLHLTSSEHHDPAFEEEIWGAVDQRGGWQGECVGTRRNGQVFPKWLSVSAVPDDGGKVAHYVAIFSDITRLKDAEERWQRLAFYDSLTRLPNRVLFKDRLQQGIARAHREEEPLVLMLIDLDDFKLVNDSLGHDAGDDLLCQAARRIEACVRESDTISRLGGDEFTVIVNGCPSDIDVTNLTEKIIQAFATPFFVGDRSVQIGASIGIARYPSDGQDPDTLTKNADAAMYAAKSGGRNTSRFFSRALGERISYHLQVRTQIAQGLQRGEFVVHLQPEIDLHTGEIVMLEALARWNHPERGLVEPAHFIPIAEESGLILELGEVVLREAIRLVAELRAGPLPEARIAVNVSRRQISAPGLVDAVVGALAAHHVPATALLLEVTESVAMGDMEHTAQVLEALRAHGVGAAIDDFGTGYSSLTYLRRLPVQCLKIDQSFVADADVSPESATIIRAITAMARSLGLRTVAEGIERRSQHDLLREVGCDVGQGYWFARPVPLAGLLGLLDGASLRAPVDD